MVNADLAMYDAEESGRDRAAFYRSSGLPPARMPGAFLYVAERLDLVQEIDRRVVERAMRIARRACRHQPRGQPVGQVDRRVPALLELTERLLRETAIDPARLTFEITETAAVANIALASAFSERLRELGVDWGQGFHLGEPAPLDEQLGAVGVAGA